MYATALSTTRIFSRAAKGFTLTEMVVVIGIFGLVLGAIWAAVGQVNENNKTQKSVSQVMQIIQGYRSLYAKNGIDAGSDGKIVNTYGINAKYFPSEMIIGGAAHHLWGGGIYVIPSQATNMLLISYGIAGPGGADALPEDACIRLASALTFLPDVIYENINATTNPSPLTAASTYTPFTISKIKGLCSAEPGNGNQLQIGFKAR
jgi:prepilin-type N-terminal cleavage/methylation domain-containing protein